MGLDCFGSLGSLLLGAGLGILAVSTLASVIIFGSYYDNLEFPSTYTRYNPLYDTDGIYASALAITILGAIAACAAIAAIALSALMGGNKIVLIIVGGAASVLALGCIISEGIYYGKARSNYINNQKANYVRNSSRAQRYIRNAIEELYTQGYENLKAEYPNDVEKMEDWDTATKNLNKQVTDGDYIRVLNYPDFVGAAPIDEKRIILSVEDGFVYANIKSSKTADEPLQSIVASLLFKCETPESYTQKNWVCWNDTTKLKCKTLDYKQTVESDERTFVISMQDRPFTIEQNMIDDDNYRTPLQRAQMFRDDKKTYRYNYPIGGIPVAYHILTADEVKEESKKEAKDYPFYFEKDTNHFRVNAKSYCKDYINYYLDEYDETSKGDRMTNFYFCMKEPSSLENIIKGKNDDCLGRYTFGGGSTSKPNFLTIAQASTGPQIFEVAYDQYEIGIYPGFHEDYFSYLADESIYNYNRSYLIYAQFAIAQLIIQIVGIVLWGAGKGIGMVFGGSD